MIHFLQASRHSFKALSLTALLGLAITGAALAEEFSDSKLRSFATALNGINQLAEQWKPEVEAAPSETRAALLQRFEAEASQVIENTEGIGNEEYQKIVEAAQSDPALTERIVAMVQEVMKEQ